MCHELPRAFCPAGYKPANTSGSGCEGQQSGLIFLHSLQLNGSSGEVYVAFPELYSCGYKVYDSVNPMSECTAA